MRYLSLIELPRLAAFQKAALATYGERWSELRRSTAAVNRDEAEAGVLSAYAAAGLAPPRQIIWGTSPREIANLWVAAVDAGGENVRALVVDLVRRKAEAAVDRAIGVAVRTALAEEPRLSRLPPFCASIDEAVSRDIPWIRLNEASLVQLGWGKYQQRVRATMTSKTSALAVDIAGDKDVTRRLLASAGLPVPRGELVLNEDDAVRAATNLRG